MSNQPAINPSRQSHLDAMRGAAALIVVLLHYFAAFYPWSIFGTHAKTSYQQHAAWEVLAFYPPFGLPLAGHFAVCLFFILSGYVLSFSHLGEAGRVPKLVLAIIKRPIRLGGLIWFTLILSALIWYFGHYYNVPTAELTRSKPWFSGFWAGSFDAGHWLLTMLSATFSQGNTYNPPLWTIKTELYGSIMVYVFLLLIGNWRYRMLVLLLLIMAFYNSLYQGFWFGLLAADIVKHRSWLANKKSYISWILLALFLYFVNFPRYVSDEFRAGTIYRFWPSDAGFDGGYPMLAAVLAFVLVLTSPALKAWLLHPVWQFLGRISYALYLLHFLLLGSFSSWLFLRLTPGMSYGSAFLIVTGSGLVLAVLMAYVATRWVDEPVIGLSHIIERKLMGWWQRLRAR
jgi:peptidoglycan/LPS O-acetylase OafA/YrhL